MEYSRSTPLRLSNATSKLIPRDINDSLGKLPPQALDMEVAVLGAVMLEKNAILDLPFLKPEHFYTEQHRTIYASVLSLIEEKKPVDMRTVVAQLRRTGQLDLVGGAYYISELTSKVSGAANTQEHAKYIYEMWIKRELIQIASKIHHDAYEDTNDAFELLKNQVERMVYFDKYATPDNSEAKIKALWDERSIKIKPEVPPPLVYFGETPIVSPGDHTLVIGKKKSRKSLLIRYIISLYFTGNKLADPHKIAIFDTEQSKFDVWLTREGIHKMTGHYVECFFLRGMPPAERRGFITNTVKHWDGKLEMIIIDGIRDLMSNINDADESTQAIYWLEDLTLANNLAVVNVLHINKTDNNARGHIGTELTNKTIATIQVNYNDKTKDSDVTCESSRKKPFEDFSFTHDRDGQFLMLGVTASGETGAMPAKERDERLDACFEGDLMTYADLRANVGTHFAVGARKAERMIAEFVRKGLVIKSGKQKDSSTTYKLVGGSVTQDVTHAPPDLFAAPPVEEEKVESESAEDLPF